MKIIQDSFLPNELLELYNKIKQEDQQENL